MSSYVDEAVAARIAAAQAKTQQQREDRAAFAKRRAVGLESRKRQKLARRCAVCDRPIKAGRGKPCVRGCGAHLCRTVHIPQCTDVHGGQCPRLELPDPAEASAT